MCIRDRSEAQRGDEFFDEERLQQVLIENAGAPSCREMREAVMAKVEAFLAGARRTDDITLLMLRRNAGG